MAGPTLIQIPFSSNCVKVRRALELKGIPFETEDIAPMDRAPVLDASGQRLVPVLRDGERVVADSTEILRHLEEAYPETPLLPRDRSRHAECWLLEDWADTSFMALTRRLAYWAVLRTPHAIETLFFPDARGIRRAVMGRVARGAVRKRFRISSGRTRRDEATIGRIARLALDRLGGRPSFFEDGLTVADVTLAAMVAPLAVAEPRVRDGDAVRPLLDWSESVVGSKTMDLYRAGPGELAGVKEDR